MFLRKRPDTREEIRFGKEKGLGVLDGQEDRGKSEFGFEGL